MSPLGSSISTHTPLAGRDGDDQYISGDDEFLLTRPSRGATGVFTLIGEYVVISTHTPLAGRDRSVKFRSTTRSNFYSHAPRGARPLFVAYKFGDSEFLLTRPSRGATSAGRPESIEYAVFLLTRPSRGATWLLVC